VRERESFTDELTHDEIPPTAVVSAMGMGVFCILLKADSHIDIA
jgi:hypothetical protein